MSPGIKNQALEIAKQNEGTDGSDFALKNSGKYDADLLRQIANQLDFRRTIQTKVPEWYESDDLVAAEHINLQQSSSEATAKFKAGYIGGHKGLDLTGGIGVDVYFFAKRFKEYTYNDPNIQLAKTVAHNFEKLGISNVNFHHQKAEEFVLEEFYDWIYLDPSRRNENNRKLYKISDCLPDLSSLQGKLMNHTDNLMVKYSPMLDIKMASNQLTGVKKILVIADKNEVKELVFIIAKTANDDIKINCVNLNSQQPEYEFKPAEEASSEPVFAEQVRTYLYEANAAILKAGAFKKVAEDYGLEKIAKNSHLYTSDELKTNFPGKVFKVVGVTTFDKRRLEEIVENSRANISIRNFPMSYEQIRKKLKWKYGGEFHLFFTQNLFNKKIVIVSKYEKI